MLRNNKRKSDAGQPVEKKPLISRPFYTLEDENSFPLPQLPADVLNHFGSYLPATKQLFLFSGNKRLYSVFKPRIRPARKVVHDFLLHVAHGELAQAEAMIRNDPGLLLEKATIKDYSGRLIEGTALQIALGAGDVSLNTHCDLISVSTLPLPTRENLREIGINRKSAYVRYRRDRLFYIDKANNYECTEIPVDKDTLEQFNAEMKPSPWPRKLTENDLKRITTLTGHIHEEGMAEMIERYLRQLPNGEAIIAAQKLEQFPAGWEKQEEERTAKDLRALREVVQAIADSEEDDDCAEVIENFFAGLQSRGVIKSGMHFNNQLIHAASKLCVENFTAFGGWNSRRNNLFWREIVGGLQCFATACDVMMLGQDSHRIFEGEKLNRSLQFRFAHHNNGRPRPFFYPLNPDADFRLGKEYAAWGGVAHEMALGCLGDADSFEILANKKRQRCAVLCGNQPIPERPRRMR